CPPPLPAIGFCWDGQGTPTTFSWAVESCPYALQPIDPVAQPFEDAARSGTLPPSWSLEAPAIDAPLMDQMNKFLPTLNTILSQWKKTAQVNSGYRPPEFQAHLFDIRKTYIKIKKDPSANCTELLKTLETEIEEWHGIARRIEQGIAVPVVGITSPHSHKDADGNPNAVAIDAGPRAVMGFAPVGGPAAGFALVRRVASDPVHFTLEPILLDVHLSIIVASPISIMVQDPQG